MSERQKKTARADITDAIGFIGLLLLSYGAWSAWHPAGFIVLGGLLFAIAVLRAMR
jgi:hypothetical protein